MDGKPPDNKSILNDDDSSGSPFDILTNMPNIPPAAQKDEYFRPKVTENLEELHGDPDLKQLYTVICQDYPRLKCVKIIDTPNKMGHNFQFDSGYSSFTSDSTISPACIYFNSNHKNTQKELYNKEANQAISDGIGINLDNAPIKIVQATAFLHEFGHAHQLFYEYITNPQDFELVSSGINMYEGDRSLDNAAYQSGQAYHTTVTEKYADEFAIDYIRRHCDDFGINAADLPKYNFSLFKSTR